MGWEEDVRRCFPLLGAANVADEWARRKACLVVGDEVTGTVIARVPFGVWIDIGVQFPALLEIIQIDGLTPEEYRSGQWCPIGSRVSASIVGFADKLPQIRLSQRSVPLLEARRNRGNRAAQGEGEQGGH
jgi:hypothetical protein